MGPEPTSSALSAAVSSAYDVFTHRHYCLDTERQSVALSKLARVWRGGGELQLLGQVVHILQFASARLKEEAGRSLLPGLNALVRCCAVAPPRNTHAEEKAYAGARVALLEQLAELTRSTDEALQAAASDSLMSVTKASILPGAPMRAALEGSSAPLAVLASMRESGPAVSLKAEHRVLRTCTALQMMCRDSAAVCTQLIDAGAVGELLRHLSSGDTEPPPGERRSADSGGIGRSETLMASSRPVGHTGDPGSARPADRAARSAPHRRRSLDMEHRDFVTEGYSSSDAEGDAPPFEPFEPAHDPSSLAHTAPGGAVFAPHAPSQRPSTTSGVRTNGEAHNRRERPATGGAGANRGRGAVDGAASPGAGPSDVASRLPTELLRLLGLLCSGNTEGSRALATPDAVRAFVALLSASLRRGRSSVERAQRTDVAGALLSVSARPEGPAILRGGGACTLAIRVLTAAAEYAEAGGAPSDSSMADVGGLFGGVRQAEDAELYVGCLRLLSACVERDEVAAREAWASPGLSDVLCDCIEGVGGAPVALLDSLAVRHATLAPPARPGGTREAFSTLSYTSYRSPAELAPYPLSGWSAEQTDEMQRSALQLLREMVLRLPRYAPPVLLPGMEPTEDDIAAELVDHRCAAIASAIGLAAVRQLHTSGPGGAPQPLLRPTLSLIASIASHHPTALRVAGVVDSLARFAFQGLDLKSMKAGSHAPPPPPPPPRRAWTGR